MRGIARLSGLVAVLLAGMAAAPASAVPFSDSHFEAFSPARQLAIDFAVPTTISGPMALTVTLVGEFVQNAENATVTIQDPLGNIDLGTIADNDPNNDLFPGADPNGVGIVRTVALDESLIAPRILDGVLSFFVTVSGAVGVTAVPPRPVLTLEIAWDAPEPPAALPAPATGLLLAAGLALMVRRRRTASGI